MAQQGLPRQANYVWDDTNKKWVREPLTTSSGGVTNVSGVEVTDFVRLMNADDLVTKVQYNEAASRTTVSGVLYTSATLGVNALETFVSGTNTLTITRTV